MPITPEEVVDAVREWARLTNAPELIEQLWAMEERAVGYGYRTAAARTPESWAAIGFQDAVARWWSQVQYFHMELQTLTTSVVGEVGLAWGTYTEEFQEQGRPAERARGRFTLTLTKTDGGWKVLLFHRDIQPFDDHGWYPRTLTAVPNAT